MQPVRFENFSDSIPFRFYVTILVIFFFFISQYKLCQVTIFTWTIWTTFTKTSPNRKYFLFFFRSLDIQFIYDFFFCFFIRVELFSQNDGRLDIVLLLKGCMKKVTSFLLEKRFFLPFFRVERSCFFTFFFKLNIHWMKRFDVR